MIEFKNVSKVYDNNVKALSNVNIKIDAGDFVFLVGPSGAGKSTFVKMLLKEIEPSEGQIIVDGIELSKIKRKKVPFHRRKIGMVFQDFRLIPSLNVYENVAFAMRVLEASPSEIKKQVPIALSLVGLSNKQKMFPNQLSGGEQQRVSIARAIVNKPLVLIADEPTGNLDDFNADVVWNLLKGANEQLGITVVVVTHRVPKNLGINFRQLSIEDGIIYEVS